MTQVMQRPGPENSSMESPTKNHSIPRVAVVQHGDYRDALRVLENNLPDPYFGMKDSVRVLEEFLEGTDYRLISIDAPPYRIDRGRGEVIGLHRPEWPKMSKYAWSWKIWRQVRSFKPTHLLIRTGGLLALPCLRYAVPRGVQSLVIMAGFMNSRSLRERELNRRLAKLYNNPSVYCVTNHRRPATLSTIRAGVDPEKVRAWDYRGLPNPKDWTPKSLVPNAVRKIAFAGAIREGKGIGDLVDAAFVLARSGVDFKLTVCGDGPMLGELKERSAPLGDRICWLGSVGNDAVQQAFREADVVCVPSRKERSEGLPFTVTEALAVRTPLVCSDHPAMKELLCGGEGLRFFTSGDVQELASVISLLCSDAEEHHKLSQTTAEAFARLDSDVTFDKLLFEWKSQWALNDAAS